MDPKTELQPRSSIEVVASLRVDVVDGPDRGASVSAGSTISIGTARDNLVNVSDVTVSRYHLEVVARPEGIIVNDLGSTNGTYVGSVRIDRATVPIGTLVTLGRTTVRFDDAVRTTIAAPTEVQELAGMIARSQPMLQLFADVERVAAAPTSTLIVGESGTGKERVAEAIHARSSRAREPFVTIDCGALSSSLLASELFGHERGAFTGADRVHVGAFERAGAGTVFLDEIGELPPADQSSLLGVLERKRFRRVGGTAELELGARVIAATNRDLRAEVNNGRFRHDLYHRLAVIVLRLPPLRERPDDILPLIRHFTTELGATGEIQTLFSADVLAAWHRRPWWGNVRELRNAVEAALVIGPGAESEEALASRDEIVRYKDARATVVRDFERTYLERIIKAAGGNVAQAARLAQMDRSHLIDLVARHGLKDRS
ncbi:MAG: sigma 54-interacting transcriptional regulator [Kofleriaceae bacterium]